MSTKGEKRELGSYDYKEMTQYAETNLLVIEIQKTEFFI